MLTVILGAPGSGKTTVASRLRAALPGHAVVDWDAFMPAVEALTGRDVRGSRELWAPYRELVRTVVDSLAGVPTVLFGVCTPHEMADWPQTRWILLDCEDSERRRRLADRPTDEVNEAVADAIEYRRLGLPVLDTSGRTVDSVARELTSLLKTQ